MALLSKSSIAFVLNSLPALVVLGTLGWVGYLGHKHDWKWFAVEDSQEEKKTEEKDEKAAAANGDAKSWGDSPFDPTLTITHNPQKCPYDHQDIPFKDRDHIRRSGISLGTIQKRSMETTLTVPAVTDFEPTRVARIAPRVGGVVVRIEKQVGDTVGPGELLAVLESLEVGKAKAAFLMAKVQLDVRKQTRLTMVPDTTPHISIVQADAAVREAEVALYTAEQGLLNLGLVLPAAKIEKETDKELARRLQFLGIPKHIIDAMPHEATGNLLPVFNPLKESAAVLQREGSRGEPVAALQTLFIIGETNELLVNLDVRQEEAQRISPGMPIRFMPDGDLAYEAIGKIETISNEVDSKTRTVRMRARIANPNGKLKAKSFGSARITLTRPEEELTVSEEAIQWEGCSHVLFVLEDKPDDDDKKEAEPKKSGEHPLNFEVHRVKLGIRKEGFVAVAPLDPGDKLDAGDRVAETGSHVLKSYLFRERIGED